MATIDELRALAREIREERQIGGNTGARVGNTFDKVADLLESTGGDISDIREAVEQLLQDVGFIPRDVSRTDTDAGFTNSEGELLFWLSAATDTLAGLITAANNNKLIALPTAEELAQALAEKQNRLTFDPRPIEGSTNPVTSDGINTAIANFVTRSVSDLIYYYTKSETYTKEEVNALVAAIKQFVPVVAQTLPTASADTMYKLYLVPSEDPQEGNIKDEYITIDNGASANPRYTWEKIGSVDIDISGKADIGTVPADVTCTASDATFVNNNHEPLFYLRQATSSLAGLMTSAEHNKLGALPTAQDLNTRLECTIYDISVLHPTSGVSGGNTYASLSAALAVIPQDKKKGGMTVRYVQSFDNKYVQCRYMGTETTGNPNPFLDTANWQGVDEEPTDESNNLVKSGGTHKYINSTIRELDSGDFSEDGFYNADNNLVVVSAYKHTPYIGVIEGTHIRGKIYKTLGSNPASTTAYIVFFNKDKSQIVGSEISDLTGIDYFDVVAPQGAYYFIATTKTDNLGNSFIFCVDGKLAEKVQELSEDVSENSSDIASIDVLMKQAISQIISENTIVLDKGGYLDTNGGYHFLDSLTSWVCSDYVSIEDGVTFEAKLAGAPNVTLLAAFYNSSKQYISNSGIAPSETYILEDVYLDSTNIPASAKYVRFCSKVDSGLEGRFCKSIVNVISDLSNQVQNVVNEVDEIKSSTDKLELINVEYRNNLHKPFSFNGKTAAFFGDSVTVGIYSDSEGGHLTDNGYYKIFSNLAGLTPSNYAVSGTYICDTDNTNNSILNKVKSTITANSNYDFIFIAGGVNDFWTGKPLGQLGDNTYATFYGALEDMCTYLDNVLNGKTTEVIFLTPINFSSPSKYATAIKPLNAYRSAIFQIATMHGYNVVDMSAIGFPNKFDDDLYKQTMIYDGIHPTILGHKMMGQNLYSILI